MGYSSLSRQPLIVCLGRDCYAMSILVDSGHFYRSMYLPDTLLLLAAKKTVHIFLDGNSNLINLI